MTADLLSPGNRAEQSYLAPRTCDPIAASRPPRGKMTSDLDLADRKLLNLLQTSLPLVEEPFEALGQSVDLGSSEVIRRIQSLKDKNVVRQISAMFDTRRLGYKTVLVAMRLPPDKLDAGAHTINAHPGVSHNYARDGAFNLWFTVAVPPHESLEETVEEMAHRTGAERYRMLPTIRFFKIGVNFDMVKEEGAAEEYYSPDGYNREPGADWNKVETVSEFEIEAIRQLQEDLPLEPPPLRAPWPHGWVSLRGSCSPWPTHFRSGASCDDTAPSSTTAGRGFKANAMGVWKVPPERAEEVGNLDGTLTLGDPLLRAADLSGLCLLALYDDPRHLHRAVRRGGEGDIRGDGDQRVPAPLQHSRVQEDARPVLRIVRLVLQSTPGPNPREASCQHYYPVFLDLKGRRCVVIGGGDIGEEKVVKLLDHHAIVTVISPDVTEGLRRLVDGKRLHWVQRKYEPADMEGAFIAIVADTSDASLNRSVSKEARTRNIPLNVADVTDLCTWIAPAVVNRGKVTVAVSTGGASPALARKFREEPVGLEQDAVPARRNGLRRPRAATVRRPE